MKALAITGLAACLVTAAFAGAGSAQSTGAALACGDPKTQPLGKIFGKNRGSTFCNDGAKATVVVAGKTVSLTGGVCWRNRTSLQVGVGSLVINDLRRSDPPGILITDVKPGDVVGDTVGFSKGTLDWTGPVKVKLGAGKKKGTFGATPSGNAVNGPLTGSFSCRRILDAPDQ